MKLVNIETKYRGKVSLPEELLNQLPGKITVAGTIQFIDQVKDIREQLKKIGHKVSFLQSIHGTVEGQMLGCDAINVKDTSAFLYIGDGKFHPTALLYENAKPVFRYNPLNGEITKFTDKDLAKVNQRRKASLGRFYAAQKIGVLVTTKPGQNNIMMAHQLKQKLKDKETYIFIGGTLDTGQLENFPFIDCWVNTACPRIVEDTNNAMVNIWEIGGKL